MITVNRKLIEEYYKQEWEELVSPKTLNFLVELTCQAYQFNKPVVPEFVKTNLSLRPLKLGEI